MKKKETIVIDNKIPFIQGILEPYADIRYATFLLKKSPPMRYMMPIC